MTFCTLGLTNEDNKIRAAYVRERGREFESEIELNAYAIEHGWPNWTPRSDRPQAADP
jgi:hypothetical protein